MAYVFCDSIHDPLMQDQCWMGIAVHFTVKFPEYLGGYRTEPVKMYLRMPEGQVSFYLGWLNGQVEPIRIDDSEWVYVGDAVAYNNNEFPMNLRIRKCIGGQYRVKFESDHFFTPDDMVIYTGAHTVDGKAVYWIHTYCPSAYQHDNVTHSAAFDMIPKTNACGESGFDMRHVLVHFTVSPPGAVGATLKIDGVVKGTMGSNGLDVCIVGSATVETVHTVTLEKFGYAYLEFPITIYPPGYGVHEVPSILDNEVWNYPVVMTRVPPNACGEYIDVAQINAKIRFNCTPAGGTLAIPFVPPYSWVVTSGSVDICLPDGWTWQATYSKTGYVSKSINIPITEDMCKTQTIYSEEITLAELPVASFVHDGAGRTLRPGDIVNFTDTSTGSPTSWVWEVIHPSDGHGYVTQYGYNPIHSTTLFISGTLSVTLTVTNTEGSSSITKSLDIYRPLVVADFYAEPTSGVAPLTVQFISTQSGTANHSWTFGDGEYSSDALPNNPVHTYVNPGSYTVTLVCVGNESSDTETKVGYITVTEVPLQCPEVCDDGEYCDGEATGYECVPVPPEPTTTNWFGIGLLGCLLGYMVISSGDEKPPQSKKERDRE